MQQWSKQQQSLKIKLASKNKNGLDDAQLNLSLCPIKRHNMMTKCLFDSSYVWSLKIRNENEIFGYIVVLFEKSIDNSIHGNTFDFEGK